MPAQLVENAPAKVNLTLRVLGRRADGYHDIESLVAFAGFGDRLTFTPGGELSLASRGPRAAQAGEDADNLVLNAARALAARIPGIVLGAFHLDKNLPVAAGLGGGSADAAAALRLLARANAIAPDDPRLYEAARATGADVPVCLDPRPRLMRGIGEKLSDPLVCRRSRRCWSIPASRSRPNWYLPAGRPPPSRPFLSTSRRWRKRRADQQFLQLLTTQPNDLEARGNRASAGDRRRACGFAQA